jgi:hypothetical protein
MPSVRVAARFAALLASAQFPAVTVPKANKGKPGLMLPGIVSSASALQVQVQPFLGHSGSGIVLGAGAAAGGCAGCGWGALAAAPGQGLGAEVTSHEDELCEYLV